LSAAFAKKVDYSFKKRERLPLHQRLGKRISYSHTKYQHYWDGKRLFVRSQNGTFNCHEPWALLHRLFLKSSQPAPLPSEATLVRVVTCRMFLYVSAHTFHIHPQKLHPHATKSFVVPCSSRERRILGVLQDFDTVSQTVSLLESGAFVTATGGFFNPYRGELDPLHKERETPGPGSLSSRWRSSFHGLVSR